MTDSAPLIFNTARRNHFKARYVSQFSNHDFLYQWVAREIKNRLADITRQFESVLLSGAHIDKFFKDIFPNATYSDQTTPAMLASQNGLYDCILSIGEMHCTNDLPGLLIQMRRALKPDGLLMVAFAGGETLHELRAALLHGEMEVTGGASPRVYPFADKQQVAGLMQRAGFALPVVDSEILTISYRDMFHVMSDIRGMGESNALTDTYKSFTSSRLFFEASKFYARQFAEDDVKSDGRVSATYEIIFCIGWSPHDSQQKPAKRGSGQVSLTEIL